jgi:hypothetical protein
MAYIDTSIQPIEITISQESLSAVTEDGGVQTANWVRMSIPIRLEPGDHESGEDTDEVTRTAIKSACNWLSSLIIECIEEHRQRLNEKVYEINSSNSEVEI